MECLQPIHPSKNEFKFSNNFNKKPEALLRVFGTYKVKEGTAYFEAAYRVATSFQFTTLKNALM